MSNEENKDRKNIKGDKNMIGRKNTIDVRTDTIDPGEKNSAANTFYRKFKKGTYSHQVTQIYDYMGDHRHLGEELRPEVYLDTDLKWRVADGMYALLWAWDKVDGCEPNLQIRPIPEGEWFDIKREAEEDVIKDFRGSIPALKGK